MGHPPEIIDKGPIEVPARQFESAFQYRMFGGGFNYYWTLEEWLVPYVGVVKRKQGIMDFGPTIYIEWTLLSYELP